MDTHEYQAKEILKKYAMPIPDFGVASTTAEAEQVKQAGQHIHVAFKLARICDLS